MLKGFDQQTAPTHSTVGEVPAGETSASEQARFARFVCCRGNLKTSNHIGRREHTHRTRCASPQQQQHKQDTPRLNCLRLLQSGQLRGSDDGTEQEERAHAHEEAIHPAEARSKEDEQPQLKHLVVRPAVVLTECVTECERTRERERDSTACVYPHPHVCARFFV